MVALLQPLLPGLTGLRAHRGGSLLGAWRGSGKRAGRAAGRLAERQAWVWQRLGSLLPAFKTDLGQEPRARHVVVLIEVMGK